MPFWPWSHSCTLFTRVHAGLSCPQQSGPSAHGFPYLLCAAAAAAAILKTLQVLELLRGLSLTPVSEADQEAKAAATAALDAAADEAVASLKQQHTTALSNAAATARHQALISTLNARIRFSPGKPPLSAAVAAAVIDTAAEELTSALADAGGLDGSSGSSGAAAVSARRLAAERIVGTASVIDSTAAALAAALGEDLAGGLGLWSSVRRVTRLCMTQVFLEGGCFVGGMRLVDSTAAALGEDLAGGWWS